MVDLKLLKLQTGIGKNGKEYYRIVLLVGNENISAFIWKNQYENIKSQLTESELKHIHEVRSNDRN